ncbi:MAG TPA: putative toxin-antitoxin system toxin component, PIN family [Desulfosporosinus sp.]|nr:putative toxin-antitoxin system toxin component, PIN family [Desulfosporosinus sp.]
MRVVLDTNVLISAIVFGGNPRKLLEAILRGEPKLFLCDYILNELIGVLLRPKFDFPPDVIRSIISELNAISYVVTPTVRIRKIKEDPADNKILECALEANADYIISGDSHLLNQKVYRNVKVITPAEYLKIHSKSEKW